MKTSVAILALVAALGLGCSEGDKIISSGDTWEQIRVVGTATVDAVPDMAQVHLGVQIFADSVDVAVAENNRLTEAVIDALKSQGIADRDLRTTSFNIYPQRDFNREEESQIIGYWVSKTVMATIREIDRVGAVLQAAVDVGANRSFGLPFGLQDSTPVDQQARILAVEDARQRAEDLARGAGVTLGKLLRINEASFFGGSVYSRAEADDKGAIPVEPGELQVKAQVEVAYKIAE